MYLGLDSEKQPILLDPHDLVTHGVILGRSGSGKSGLTVTLLEEVSDAGIASIVFDPKGDLTNLALALTSEEEFAKWAPAGENPTRLLEAQRAGLEKFGLGEQNILNWAHKVRVRVYSPGRTFGGGRSVNIFPTFDPPKPSSVPPIERASRDVGAVLEALGEGSDPYAPAQVFLVEALLSYWSRGQSLSLGDWPGVLTQPPAALASIGGMPLDEFFPKRTRTRLARKLIGFRHQADRWLTGEIFNFHEHVRKREMAIFTMRHLPEDDRLFFTSLMMNKLVDFMFETAASQKLKLLVALDEARGYLPPHPRNPSTKAPICTLLAQGRAQGIGLLIGTQNPMDLDYKALSNVGTWFVGRLRERDCSRDLSSELAGRNADIAEIEAMPQRHFLTLDKYGEQRVLQVRQTLHYLRGPLGATELLGLEPNAPDAPVIRIQPVAATGQKQRARRSLWGKVFGWDAG